MTVCAVLALVAALGALAARHDWRDTLPAVPLVLAHACVVTADGQVNLDAHQMANAATIAAVGIRQEMPEYAVVVALATALQESKLENLSGGDRDSVGLFQQRPSQGWGTPDEILDPRYAAARFYGALRKVEGWEDMRVTDAAQRVQRSAFPEAYQKWAEESEVLAKALFGKATGAVSCTISGEPEVRGAAAAAALADGLSADWGKLRAATADRAGLTVEVRDDRDGWRYAHWLVSHATDHGVERVLFGGLEWDAKDGDWSPIAGVPAAGTGRVVAEVFD
ncbi:hypothetical protein J2S41_005393 [Catenuloplanes atrovinosus]|uniref:Cobalt transporter n=1 Tax=Catenuloplanes atrovinosus TaxID=137266 RepID=A0AAE3YS32_9ACTN|nr:hypothetical protein [Catenuloplanes atrovinosus]